MRWRGCGTALAVLVFLAGCASDEGRSAVARPAPSTPEMEACLRLTAGAPWHGDLTVRSGSTTIDAGDDYFTPTCVLAPANRPLSLTITNRGHVPHRFTITATRTNASLDAGGTGFVTVRLGTEPLPVVCSFHADEHMVAALVPVG